jgi:hypothetical protein
MAPAPAYRMADQRRQNRVGIPPAFDCHVLYSSRHGHECRPRRRPVVSRSANGPPGIAAALFQIDYVLVHAAGRRAV